MAGERPNIVFIMPDQLRPDFLGCYGADFVATPHVDALATEGIRYRRAYSTVPVCVPTRAALLTGRTPIANGVTWNDQWLRPDLAATGVRTWPELLSAQGYLTAAIGKMHFYPWDARMGFQHRVAAEDKRWLHVRDDYYRYLRGHGLRKLHGNEHDNYQEQRGAVTSRIPWEHSVDRYVGEQAASFIDTYAGDGPFAMMVGFPGPHCPYDPTAEFLAGVDPQRIPPPIPVVEDNAPQLRTNNLAGQRRPWNGVDYSVFTDEHKRVIRTHYAALVNQIDWCVGLIVDALEAAGVLDRTMIVFASDHGDYLGDHGMIGKGSFYESSCHVPLIVRPPGGVSAVEAAQLVELGDVTATLLEAGGVSLPDYLHARPLPEAAGAAGRSVIFGAGANGWMWFDGRWKLAVYRTGEVLLFDLETDPHEQTDRSGDLQQAQRMRQMWAELATHVMFSIEDSHSEKHTTATGGVSGNPAFGYEGWQRPYPAPAGPPRDR